LRTLSALFSGLKFANAFSVISWAEICERFQRAMKLSVKYVVFSLNAVMCVF
jgi:hypothetical protein